MAKTKPRAPKRITNPHLHARIAYLHRASTYLATIKDSTSTSEATQQGSPEGQAADATNGSHPRIEQRSPEEPAFTMPSSQSSSRHMVTHLRSVARKSQIRLSGDVKHSICKVCDTRLVQGHTSTTSTENKSRDGQKAWAQVSCVSCNACGAVKRYPTATTRQLKKANRPKPMPLHTKQEDSLPV